MSDTTWIKNTLEPYVRTWLSLQYPGHTFVECKMPLAGGGEYLFDAVSEDALIVAHVLANRAVTASGNRNTGGMRKALNDLDFLRRVPATTKLMVFTDAHFMDYVRRRAVNTGGIGDIQMLLCPLPTDLAQSLRDVLDKASGEQRSRLQHA